MLLSTAICPSSHFSRQVVTGRNTEGPGSVGFCFSSSQSRTHVKPAVAFSRQPLLIYRWQQTCRRPRGLLTGTRGAQPLGLTCSFLLLTKAVWELGHRMRFNPSCYNPSGSQTAFLWQREETCDEASSCVHRENASVFIDFNEKSLEPVKSCYFLAPNLAPSPSRQVTPCTWHLPAPCPAVELQNALLQALGQRKKAFKVKGC